MGHQQGLSVDLVDVVAKGLNERGFTTQRARATATGIKASTLDRRLKRQTPFKATELAAIADLFGIKLSDLVGAAEDAA